MTDIVDQFVHFKDGLVEEIYAWVEVQEPVVWETEHAPDLTLLDDFEFIDVQGNKIIFDPKKWAVVSKEKDTYTLQALNEKLHGFDPYEVAQFSGVVTGLCLVASKNEDDSMVENLVSIAAGMGIGAAIAYPILIYDSETYEELDLTLYTFTYLGSVFGAVVVMAYSFDIIEWVFEAVSEA